MQAASTEALPTTELQRIAEELGAVQDPKERARLLISYADELPPMPKEAKIMKNRVMGCTAQVNSLSAPPPWYVTPLHACFPHAPCLDAS